MNNKIFKKTLRLSKDLQHLCVGRTKHLSFLIDKNSIISIGWNNSYKTHPLAKKFNYRFNAIHSELACVINCQKKITGSMYMINTRILDNNFAISKPCKYCENLLLCYNVTKVYYTTRQEIKCLNLRIKNLQSILKF